LGEAVDRDVFECGGEDLSLGLAVRWRLGVLIGVVEGSGGDGLK
jgi:hypothetical protein